MSTDGGVHPNSTEPCCLVLDIIVTQSRIILFLGLLYFPFSCYFFKKLIKISLRNNNTSSSAEHGTVLGSQCIPDIYPVQFLDQLQKESWKRHKGGSWCISSSLQCPHVARGYPSDFAGLGTRDFPPSAYTQLDQAKSFHFLLI